MVQRVRVKICGITSLEHATAAAEAGADALGFVFYPPSVRAITPAQCAAICRELPPFVTKVGLFVNPEADQVRQIVAETGIELLQFHGQETPEFCEQFALPWIKGLGVRGDTDILAEAARFANAQGLLVDSFDPVRHGGTGVSFDWRLIPDTDHAPASILRYLILAGGLTPENVGDAIASVQPYAVDVSGGVESSPGVKSADRIRLFMREVNSVSGAR